VVSKGRAIGDYSYYDPTDVYVKIEKNAMILYHGKILRDFSLGSIMGRFYVTSAMI
jgi:hypothetical protein